MFQVAMPSLSPCIAFVPRSFQSGDPVHTLVCFAKLKEDAGPRELAPACGSLVSVLFRPQRFNIFIATIYIYIYVHIHIFIRCYPKRVLWVLKSNILGFRYIFLGVKACELPTIWAFDCFHCLKNPLVSIDGYKTNKKTNNMKQTTTKMD